MARQLAGRRNHAMITTIAARTAQMTAAIVSATLLTAFVTVLPVPAKAELHSSPSTISR
jgi:hypothetical protein